MAKPRVGIYGLTGCAGDELVLLNCEDELLEIVGAVDLKSFVTAQSHPEECALDIAFVEGAVAQPHDLEVLLDVRRRAGLLIAIGTCAVWGGVAGAKNDQDRAALKRLVYREAGYPESFPPQPLSTYVQVDFSLPGCPVEKEQLLHSLAVLLHGDPPQRIGYPVCTECRIAENVCLLKERGLLCCGPLTQGGCGARCPSHNRPCIGCRGPVEEANVASEYRILLEKGYGSEEILRRLGTFARVPHLADLIEKEAKKHAQDIA